MTRILKFFGLLAMMLVPAVAVAQGLDANQRMMGVYTTDECGTAGKGMSLAGVTDCPADLITGAVVPKVQYSKLRPTGLLTHVRFAACQPMMVKSIRLYNVKGGDIQQVYVQNVGKMCEEGWNTVELDEACPVARFDDGMLLAYEYVQQVGEAPLSVIGGDSDNFSWLVYGNLTSGNGLGWYSFSSEGMLSIQGIVTDESLASADIVLSNFALASKMAAPSDKMYFGFDISNFGNIGVNSFKLQVSMDGKPVASLTEKDIPVTSVTTNQVCSVSVPADFQRGQHTVTLSVAEVNGKVPTVGLDDDMLTNQFSVYFKSDVVERQQYLVEEFTSHTCTYCPQGAAVIEEMQRQMDNLAVVCIHGNQTAKDPYNTDECEQMISYATALSFPSACIDRIYFDDTFGIAPAIGYQNATNGASYLVGVLKNSALPAFASVQISQQLTGNVLRLTISGKGGDVARQLLKDYNLTVYVVEDSLKNRQLNNGVWRSNYWHRHVMRKMATAVNGDPIHWTSDSEYSNELHVMLDESWQRDQLSIVAFLHKAQPVDNPDYHEMAVTNANSVAVTSGSMAGDEDEPIELVFAHSPQTEECMFVGEGLSANGRYMAGTNYAGFYPCIWDAVGGEIRTFTQYEDGWLCDVNSQGIAVGTSGLNSAPALVCRMDGSSTILSDNSGSNSSSSVAYAISDDGSVIAGYYDYFRYTNAEQTEGIYCVYPCIWRDGICIDLPMPKTEEVGFNVDGAGIRWMNGDGSVLLGYLIDDMATWPAILWRKNAEGGYDYDFIGRDFFRKGEGDMHPYESFSPTGISHDGRWVALQVVRAQADGNGLSQAARLDLQTMQLQVLALTDYANVVTSGIADDGTVLCFANPLTITGRVSYVWPAGSDQAVCLDDIFMANPVFPAFGGNVACKFSADGKLIGGFAANGDFSFFSYVFDYADYLSATPVQGVKEEVADGHTYTLTGQRIATMNKPGLYIKNGKKVQLGK